MQLLGAISRDSLDKFLHSRRRLLTHLLRHVAVDVEREARGRVAEILLHGLDVVAALERRHREFVAEVVEALIFKAHVLYHFLEETVDRVVADVHPVFVREHEVPRVKHPRDPVTILREHRKKAGQAVSPATTIEDCIYPLTSAILGKANILRGGAAVDWGETHKFYHRHFGLVRLRPWPCAGDLHPLDGETDAAVFHCLFLAACRLCCNQSDHPVRQRGQSMENRSFLRIRLFVPPHAPADVLLAGDVRRTKLTSQRGVPHRGRVGIRISRAADLHAVFHVYLLL